MERFHPRTNFYYPLALRLPLKIYIPSSILTTFIIHLFFSLFLLGGLTPSLNYSTILKYALPRVVKKKLLGYPPSYISPSPEGKMREEGLIFLKKIPSFPPLVVKQIMQIYHFKYISGKSSFLIKKKTIFKFSKNTLTYTT